MAKNPQKGAKRAQKLKRRFERKKAEAAKKDRKQERARARKGEAKQPAPKKLLAPKDTPPAPLRWWWQVPEVLDDEWRAVMKAPVRKWSNESVLKARWFLPDKICARLQKAGVGLKKRTRVLIERLEDGRELWVVLDPTDGQVLMRTEQRHASDSKDLGLIVIGIAVLGAMMLFAGFLISLDN